MVIYHWVIAFEFLEGSFGFNYLALLCGELCKFYDRLNNNKTIMNGYIANIEEVALENNYFRKVLYTATYCQLVVMSLQPGEDIGEEVHGLDQFIRCESGEGKAVLDGVSHELKENFVLIVPAGARHNIINTSTEKSMKLYTVYSPPNHRDGVVHETKTQAETDTESFDGKTSE